MDKRNSENFIMLPTVDFCFKELMQNPKVRQGFIAAIMGKDPLFRTPQRKNQKMQSWGFSM